MKKYEIFVDFGVKGYTVIGNIFRVVYEILRNPKARCIEVRDNK